MPVVVVSCSLGGRAAESSPRMDCPSNKSAMCLSSRLFRMKIGASLLAAATAAGAARYHDLPNLIGFSGPSLLNDLEAWCALLSSGAALFVGVTSSVLPPHGARLSSGTRVALFVGWLGLTSVLLAGWWSVVLYFALPLAPSHAWGVIGLAVSVHHWRNERRRAR